MAKKWFIAEFRKESYWMANNEALRFINQHKLGADEFKISFFDETPRLVASGRIVGVTIFYLAETELEDTEL